MLLGGKEVEVEVDCEVEDSGVEVEEEVEAEEVKDSEAEEEGLARVVQETSVIAANAEISKMVCFFIALKG